MSTGSELQSALEYIWKADYASLAIVTTIVYDYVLNFSREIEYVWCRQWTLVSTMYILVRYIGLYWGIIDGLGGSTFIRGPVTVTLSSAALRDILNEDRKSEGSVVFLVCSWAFPVFLGAADLVMILRVRAVWNRSKIILGILLFIYVPQIITIFIFTGIYENPTTYLSVTIGQMLDLEWCNYTNSTAISTDLYFTLPRLIFSVVVFALAITQTWKQTITFYRATNIWQPNHFMERLTRDGILYFIMNVVFNVTQVLQYGPYFTGLPALYVETVTFMAYCPLVPRFILDLRQMYDSEVAGHRQGIDTAFGGSQGASSWGGPPSAVAFADGSTGEGQDGEDSEGIRVIELGSRRV